MKMKRIIYLSLIAFLTLSTTANAQRQGKPHKAEMQAKIFQKKMAYFKENLMLNKSESSKFESAYEQYAQERMKLKKGYKTDIIDKVKNGGVADLTEAEQKQIIDQKLELDQKLCELNRNFTLKLTHILPSEKVIRYFKMKRQFNRELMKRLRKRRRSHQGPGRAGMNR